MKSIGRTNFALAQKVMHEIIEEDITRKTTNSVIPTVSDNIKVKY